MNDFQNAFGDHLKKLRKSKQMTQEQLAEKSELSVQYLGDVERGKANPTLAIVEKISYALNLSVHDLFDTSEFQASTEELREALQDYVTRADAGSLRQLHAILRAISR